MSDYFIFLNKMLVNCFMGTCTFCNDFLEFQMFFKQQQHSIAFTYAAIQWPWTCLNIFHGWSCSTFKNIACKVFSRAGYYKPLDWHCPLTHWQSPWHQLAPFPWGQSAQVVVLWLPQLTESKKTTLINFIVLYLCFQ